MATAMSNIPCEWRSEGRRLSPLCCSRLPEKELQEKSCCFLRLQASVEKTFFHHFPCISKTSVLKHRRSATGGVNLWESVCCDSVKFPSPSVGEKEQFVGVSRDSVALSPTHCELCHSRPCESQSPGALSVPPLLTLHRPAGAPLPLSLPSLTLPSIHPFSYPCCPAMPLFSVTPCVLCLPASHCPFQFSPNVCALTYSFFYIPSSFASCLI